MYSCLVGLADRSGVVEIFTFFELEPRLNIKKDLTWQAKITIFQRFRTIIIEFYLMIIVNSDLSWTEMILFMFQPWNQFSCELNSTKTPKSLSFQSATAKGYLLSVKKRKSSIA